MTASIETTFPVHTADTAPEGSRDILRQVRSTLGMVPNLAAAMAESPTLVEAFFAVRDICARGSLSPAEIQVLSLANAFANRCEWCVAFHSFMASREGVAHESVAALREGRVPDEPRLAALTRLSRTMIEHRGEVSPGELEAFLAAGFTRAQALEVVLGVSFSVMANFAGHLAHPPLDPPFQPHHWQAPAAR